VTTTTSASRLNRYLVWLPLAALSLYWLLAYAGLAPGEWTWGFLRLTGVIGYALLALSVASGALLAARFAPPAWLAKPLQYGWHGLTAGSGLALVGIHVALSLVSAHYPQSLDGVLVPGLATFSPFAMGLGTIGTYLLLAPYLSFAGRRVLSGRWVKVFHLFAYPGFAAGTLHGMLIGSDRLAWLYLAGLALVAFTVSVRLAEGRCPRLEAGAHEAAGHRG